MEVAMVPRGWHSYGAKYKRRFSPRIVGLGEKVAFDSEVPILSVLAFDDFYQ